MVVDTDGKPVEDPEAVAIRDQLIEDLQNIRTPDGPLDQILTEFGTDQVAEVTGRQRRVVMEQQDDGSYKPKLESRGDIKAVKEAGEFQDDRRRILIFSEAGGTGQSYHASKTAKNQRMRRHYILQPGWRADSALQGMGRTHRTNQAQPPEFVLVSTNLKAQKRFISSIARRLDQLGALTKGQRQTGSGGLFSAADNLESDIAQDALDVLMNDLRGNRVEGLAGSEFEQQTGLKLWKTGADGVQTPAEISIPQFLNRLLSLKTSMQDSVFGSFDERLQKQIEQAKQDGTLDEGVEKLTADSVRAAEERIINTDKRSGAQTKYVRLQVRNRFTPLTWNQAIESTFADSKGNKAPAVVRNMKSGNVFVLHAMDPHVDPATGRFAERFRAVGISGARIINAKEAYSASMERIPSDQAQAAWEENVKNAPEFRTRDAHWITGALLPVWDRLPNEHVQVYRTTTDDGQPLLGREIRPGSIGKVLESMGAGGAAPTPAEALALLRDGQTVRLANGWRLVPAMFSGEKRIELKGKTDDQYELSPYSREFANIGVIKETANFRNRYFVPNGDAAFAETVGKLTENRPMLRPAGSESGTVNDPDKLNQADRIPGDARLAMPDPNEGIESLIAWALRERERTIEAMRQRAERGGDMAKEYQRTQADYEAVDPDVLAKDMREFPNHYLRAVTAAGGNMDPVQVYRRRVEMPPQMPRIQPAPVPPANGEAPDLMATMRSLRDDLRKAAPGAPTLAVDRGALPEQAGGEFDTRTKAITTKYHNDLDLVAHEVGHWASEEYGLLPDSSNTAARAELARLSVHGSKAAGDTAQREGMAEYLRAWMVNPGEAEAQAPVFSQIMREKLPGSVADALRSYGDAVRRFEGATALQKMAAGQMRMEPAMAEQRKMGQAWAPVALAVRDWLGKGNGEVKARPGSIPSQWEASAATKARFHLTDKEAPQLANYLLSLTLTGLNPASVKPSEHWDYLRKGLRGVAGKLRDGISQYGLPNQDGSAATDPVTGKPMAMPWLLEQAMESKDVAAFLDKAHAYGSAQRTMELAERFTNKAEEEIQRVAESAMDEVGNDKFRRRAAEDRVVQFAEERRKQLRMQLARITAAGGGIESATEVARKAVDEMANDPERAAVEEYLRRYRAWADWNLSYAVQSELMSPTQAETIRQANQFYIDWHRVFADDDGPVNLGEAVTGSSRTMHNPLASLLHATWGTVTRGDRNRAMLTFTAPLRSSPASVHGQRALSSLGRKISDQDAEEAKAKHQGYKDDGAGNKQRVYQVQRTVQEVNDEGQPLTGPNGEPMQRVVTDHWVFDPATEASMEAMRAMGGDSMVPALMQSLVNLQRLAITSAPSFRFRVPVRDNIERMLNSEVGSGPVDALRGLGQLTVTDPLTGEEIPVDRLFSQSGASMAGWSQRTREQAMADVFAHVADMRKKGWRVLTPGGAWRWWQEFGEKAENIARKAEFVAAFQKARKPTTAGGLGYSQLDASLYAMTQARGLLDTAESGRTIGQINRVFLFVNAATKGLQRTTKITRMAAAAYRRGDTATGNKLAGLVAMRLAVWGGSLYALRMLILSMMDDKDQEEMLQAPAWKRDFSIMLPDFGMGKVAIAKPYEWGFIGSGFERLADATWASQKAAAYRRQGRTADAQRWSEYADRSHEGWAHSGMTAVLPLKFDDVLGGGLTPVAEVAKKHGVSDVTIYAWRKRFGQLEAVDVKRLRQLVHENGRLKKVLAERARFPVMGTT
jgi:hypothetical protein